MTRKNSARIAGVAYLAYLIAGIAAMVLYGQATGGADVAAKLASVAQHATQLRATLIFNLIASFCALTLGVTLYGLTREVSNELAVMGMAFRLVESVNAAIGLQSTAGVLKLATATGDASLDPATTNMLGAFLLRPGTPISATYFAVGNLIFCWLLLRGRMSPTSLALLGLVSSLLLVVVLPLQAVGLIGPPFTSFFVMWLPMLVFELAFAALLLADRVMVRAPSLR